MSEQTYLREEKNLVTDCYTLAISIIELFLHEAKL